MVRPSSFWDKLVCITKWAKCLRILTLQGLEVPSPGRVRARQEATFPLFSAVSPLVACRVGAIHVRLPPAPGESDFKLTLGKVFRWKPGCITVKALYSIVSGVLAAGQPVTAGGSGRFRSNRRGNSCNAGKVLWRLGGASSRLFCLFHSYLQVPRSFRRR